MPIAVGLLQYGNHNGILPTGKASEAWQKVWALGVPAAAKALGGRSAAQRATEALLGLGLGAIAGPLGMAAAHGLSTAAAAVLPLVKSSLEGAMQHLDDWDVATFGHLLALEQRSEAQGFALRFVSTAAQIPQVLFPIDPSSLPSKLNAKNKRGGNIEKHFLSEYASVMKLHCERMELWSKAPAPKASAVVNAAFMRPTSDDITVTVCRRGLSELRVHLDLPFVPICKARLSCAALSVITPEVRVLEQHLAEDTPLDGLEVARAGAGGAGAGSRASSTPDPPTKHRAAAAPTLPPRAKPRPLQAGDHATPMTLLCRFTMEDSIARALQASQRSGGPAIAVLLTCVVGGDVLVRCDLPRRVELEDQSRFDEITHAIMQDRRYILTPPWEVVKVAMTKILLMAASSRLLTHDANGETAHNADGDEAKSAGVALPESERATINQFSAVLDTLAQCCQLAAVLKPGAATVALLQSRCPEEVKGEDRAMQLSQAIAGIVRVINQPAVVAAIKASPFAAHLQVRLDLLYKAAKPALTPEVDRAIAPDCKDGAAKVHESAWLPLFAGESDWRPSRLVEALLSPSLKSEDDVAAALRDVLDKATTVLSFITALLEGRHLRPKRMAAADKAGSAAVNVLGGLMLLALAPLAAGFFLGAAIRDHNAQYNLKDPFEILSKLSDIDDSVLAGAHRGYSAPGFAFLLDPRHWRGTMVDQMKLEGYDGSLNYVASVLAGKRIDDVASDRFTMEAHIHRDLRELPGDKSYIELKECATPARPQVQALVEQLRTACLNEPAQQLVWSLACAAGSVHRLRHLLSTTFVVGVIGTARLGKSHLIKTLFHVETNAGPRTSNSTRRVKLFRSPTDPGVAVMDFPGTTPARLMYP